MTSKTLTQNEILKKHFSNFKRLTQRDATIHMGIMRLSERVRELEREGWIFAHNMIQVPTRYGKQVRVAQYELKAAPKVAA